MDALGKGVEVSEKARKLFEVKLEWVLNTTWLAQNNGSEIYPRLLKGSV
jgi:hypothetical protein